MPLLGGAGALVHALCASVPAHHAHHHDHGQYDCLSYICIVSKYKDYTFDYDDMAGYLHYVQLQFSIGPSEGSWRSKEHIFKIKGH